MTPDEIQRHEGRELFGSDAIGYAEGRPGYPAWVFELLEERAGLGPGTAVLEVGPGGGQATAELLARGAAPLVAVEPNAHFVQYLRTRFGERITVQEAAFEEAELAPAAFALAACASAFHWVDQERGLEQVARALRPGGHWAAWWNTHADPDRDDVLAQAIEPLWSTLRQSSFSARGARPSFHRDREARIADLEANGAFDHIEVDELAWTLTLDADGARALTGTFSPVLTLEPETRRAFLDQVEEIVRTQLGGRVERPARTLLYLARRRS